MVLKVLIYRGLVVLSFYIPIQPNISYQSKHNMGYNKEKKMRQPCSNQQVVIINYPLLMHTLSEKIN
jgi:hypothetical protein